MSELQLTLMIFGIGALLLALSVALKNPVFKSFFLQPSFLLTLIILLGFVIGLGRVDMQAASSGGVDLAGTGKLIRAITVILAAFVSLVLLATSNGVKYLFVKNNALLMMFVFLCIASTVFSPAKTITLFKSFEILTMVMILAIFYCYDKLNDKSVKYIYALFWIYTITVLGVYVQLAIFGTEGQRQLLGAQPLFGFMMWSRYPGMAGNSLGFLGALVALYGVHLASVKNKKNKHYIVAGGIFFLLGFGVTVLSYTRSVLAFLFIAILMYFILRKKYGVTVLMVIIMVMPLAAPQVQDKIVEHLKRGDSEESIATMSGRTEMWSSVFNRDPLVLMVGGGYATGSQFMNYEETGSLLITTNVHNGFLEVVMSVGLIGGGVWLAIMVRVFMQLHQFLKKVGHKISSRERDFHIFVCCVFFLCYARSLMNSTFVYLDYFFPVLVGMIIYADSLKGRIKEINNADLEVEGEDIKSDVAVLESEGKYTGVTLR